MRTYSDEASIIGYRGIDGSVHLTWQGSRFAGARVSYGALRAAGRGFYGLLQGRYLMVMPAGHNLNDFAVFMRRDNPLAYPLALWYRVLWWPTMRSFYWFMRGLYALHLAWWPESGRVSLRAIGKRGPR